MSVGCFCCFFLILFFLSFFLPFFACVCKVQLHLRVELLYDLQISTRVCFIEGAKKVLFLFS